MIDQIGLTFGGLLVGRAEIHGAIQVGVPLDQLNVVPAEMIDPVRLAVLISVVRRLYRDIAFEGVSTQGIHQDRQKPGCGETEGTQQGSGSSSEEDLRHRWYAGIHTQRDVPAEPFLELLLLLDDMGCQAGVIAANLTTMKTEDKTKTTKSYDTIKLGIDAHAKWP